MILDQVWSVKNVVFLVVLEILWILYVECEILQRSVCCGCWSEVVGGDESP